MCSLLNDTKVKFLNFFMNSILKIYIKKLHIIFCLPSFGVY
ncbi:hypothetical protein LEP1GSC170_6223 [Leptospira interrogans serovar Bataviae str. HAI135]|nr:hypothetical protein LEP1GSC170_6223 [Leptospira interrogans serovar Bataviae str. HAI135]